MKSVTDHMSREVRIPFLIGMFTPSRNRKKDSLHRALFGLSPAEESNKSRTIFGRTSYAIDTLDGALHFLVGYLTLLPHLHLKRASQLQADGEQLLDESYAFLMKMGDPSVSKLRKLRVFTEKIHTFAQKVESDLKRR